MDVRFSPRALSNTIECGIFWRATFPARADEFHDELVKSVAFIVAHPLLSPKTLSRRYKGARKRVMARTEHLLLYRVESPNVVEIIGVLPSRKTKRQP